MPHAHRAHPRGVALCLASAAGFGAMAIFAKEAYAGGATIPTLLAVRFPETPRVGILRIETTRGDRLFISLLGSAFLHLAWLFFFGTALFWGALIVSLVYAAAVFRWV